MMTSFYNRMWSVTIDDPEDENKRLFSLSNFDRVGEDPNPHLKMTFNVSVLSGGYESYLDLSIYNLSEESRNFLSDAQYRADENFKNKKGKELSIGLYAGYTSFGYISYGMVFTGRVKNHVVTRRGADIVYRIMATTTVKRHANYTLGRDTTISQIIPVLAEKMNLNSQINPLDFRGEPFYSRGYTINGDPKLVLRRLAKTHNFNWVVEKNDLIVYKKDVPKSSARTIVSAETGMEGVPEITETGCSFTTRLRFDFVIGNSFQIDSAFYEVNFSSAYHMKISNFYTKGIYNVLNLEYSGDTHGNDWSTKVTGTISSVG